MSIYVKLHNLLLKKYHKKLENTKILSGHPFCSQETEFLGSGKIECGNNVRFGDLSG